jgi:aldose 1-epimerase
MAAASTPAAAGAWLEAPQPFGEVAGQPVTLYTLHGGGLRVQVIDYGAAIISIRQPAGRAAEPAAGAVSTHPDEVTLCFRTLPELVDETTNPYFGCTVGRYANRIKGGRFSVGGVAYDVPKTFRGQYSHGRWNYNVWRVMASGVLPEQAGVAPARAFVTLRHDSPAGDEGFPGAVAATATYSVSADAVLGMEFSANVTGGATPLNMCNHAYFNLSGGMARDVKSHELYLAADAVVDVDDVTQIPTGKLVRVADDDRFDFASGPRALGARLCEVAGGQQEGYDHSWVVRAERAAEPESAAVPVEGQHAVATAMEHAAPKLAAGYGLDASPGRQRLRPAARLYDPTSGRAMEVYTTQPCVHLYTTNFLRGQPPFDRHWAACLETQFPPDSPNQPQCGSCVVGPGAGVYRHVTLHRFSHLPTP